MSWNCFPEESPQIKPHPEDYSQCSRRASVSTVPLHRPRQRIISYHYVIHPGFCCRKSNSLFSKLFSSELLLQDLPLPLVTSCVYWQSSSSRRLAKASPMLFGRIASAPLSLFREGIADNHHPKPEWHHISYRLLCNTWQIQDFKQIFIWT